MMPTFSKAKYKVQNKIINTLPAIIGKHQQSLIKHNINKIK